MSAERPVLVDRFLEDAVEVDVDAIRDARGEVLIGGVMEHVEEAGVHSGDSACAIPPQSLSPGVVAEIEGHVRALAGALDVRGLLNVQFASKDGEVFVLEANPRASRTVPFVAKATGVPVAKLATRVMVGETLEDLRRQDLLPPADRSLYRTDHVSVKEAVLPFDAVPRRRLAARARDAFDRRGHGNRQHLRPGLRQEPAGGGFAAPPSAARSSCPWPIATRRPASRWLGGSPSSVSRWPRRRARPERFAGWDSTSRPRWPRWGRRAGGPTPSA